MREARTYVYFDAFGYRVTVTFSDNLQKSRDRYNKKFRRSMTVSENAGAFHTSIQGDPESYIFFKWDADEETIAHEAWHSVRHMLVYVGAELEDEVVAYHLGHLVGRIHRFKKEAQQKEEQCQSKRS